MSDSLSVTVNSVTASLSREEHRTLQYLCSDLFSNSCGDDVRGALLAFATQNQSDQTPTSNALLMELMYRMKRFDILRKILGTNREEVEGFLRNSKVLSDYRVLMAEVSENLDEDDLQSLMFLLTNRLPKERLKRAKSFLDVVVELEQLDEVSSEKLELLEQILMNIRRMDLVKRIQVYQNKGKKSVPCPIKKSYKNPPVQCTRQPIKHVHSGLKDFSKLKLSVPETGISNRQVSLDEYQMNPDQRGLCVIVDCVGCDGEMLLGTFERLGFRVVLHSLLGVAETQKVLEGVRRQVSGHHVGCFICCLISRGSDTRLFATDSHWPGINLEDLRELFSPARCPSLSGKPKLFFTQLYTSTEEPRSVMDDECLETDGPEVTERIPESADVVWSVCTAEARLLGGSGNRSVYLQALNSALLLGCGRKLQFLDMMTELNRIVFEHNLKNPDKKYLPQISHTLRKKLYF